MYGGSTPNKSGKTTVTRKHWVRGLIALVAVFVLVHHTPSDTKDRWRSKLMGLGKEHERLAPPGGLVEVPGIGRHTATVILLHGLGSNAATTLPPVKRIRRQLFQVSWMLPNSQLMPVTALDGATKAAWFDMKTLDTEEHSPLPKNEDETNMKLAVKRVHELVDAELAKGIEANRIVLAGFSQGCAITLLAGLSAKQKLAGMMCFSGWLPLTDQLHKDKNGTMHPMQTDHAHNLPVFWGHGTGDTTIRYGWGEQSRDVLKEMGFNNIESHTYPGMGHWVGAEEEEDMRHWLARTVPQV